MNLAEFKAWFEGFTEDLSGPPNKKQWTRIQERVAEITGQAVSYPVYIDRYVRPLQPYWYGANPLYGAVGIAGVAQGAAMMNGNAAKLTNASRNVSNSTVQAFDSCNAMADVGRADARAMAA